jgi:hypothetical protein
MAKIANSFHIKKQIGLYFLLYNSFNKYNGYVFAI